MQNNQEYIAFIGEDGKEEVIIPLEGKSETVKSNLISTIRKAIKEQEKDDFEVQLAKEEKDRDEAIRKGTFDPSQCFCRGGENCCLNKPKSQKHPFYRNNLDGVNQTPLSKLENDITDNCDEISLRATKKEEDERYETELEVLADEITLKSCKQDMDKRRFK